ncbi:hypothetical protein GBA63_13625 [Rubrobacter tropicus]|uniref:Uncharacterized protein n=1 Tax=Rubrobacter tropicus TaxID=2653851 RepID=A0A6G8QAP7_9ACTN|nr:PD40 domain-containing protein [Rubrobacter tropicus]QIN83560.1 hypothetical protein GBA63_13625 [Rubrobacter tropicus]
MTKTGQIKLFMLIAAVSLALLALLATKPAEAAFPGKNGKIIFWSDRSTGPGLYTTFPGNSTAAKVPGTSPGESQPTWSPDGTRIVFQSTSRNSKEISVMNADGSGRQQLTSTDTIAEQEPTWSPDGTRIAFVAGKSDTDTTTDLEIWVMDADGSDLVQMTNTPQGVRDTQPAWSPDGSRFAFLSEGRPGDTNSNIYVMDANPATNDALNLTDDDSTMTPVYQYNDEDPTWSPDGTRIAYSTKADVWTMNASNGSGKVNLTTGDGGGSQPTWSPDGNSIAYVRGGDIWMMDESGANKKGVDTTLRKDEKPDWQQDSIPPQTTITSGPPNPTRNAAASLGFVSSETGSAFECSLDGAAFAGCASPKTYTVANGTHTFRVRATDVAGNADATPAVRTWTVDTIKPTISAMRPLSGSTTSDRTPTIRATVKDNLTNLVEGDIKLYVNGALIPAAKYTYGSSTDVLVYNSPSLSAGKKNVRLVATDEAGNVGARSWSFTVR